MFLYLGIHFVTFYAIFVYSLVRSVFFQPALCEFGPLAFSFSSTTIATSYLIRTWDISSDAFYDYLERKIAAEISANTGRTIRPADFSGFKYRKKGGADINITIVAYKRPGLCKVTARSMQETITNTFVIKEKDGKLEVTMTASISAYESQKNKHVIMEAALLFLCLAFPHGQSTGQYV